MSCTTRLSVRLCSLCGYRPHLTGEYPTLLTLRPNSLSYGRELRICPNRQATLGSVRLENIKNDNVLCILLFDEGG